MLTFTSIASQPGAVGLGSENNLATDAEEAAREKTASGTAAAQTLSYPLSQKALPIAITQYYHLRQQTRLDH